MLMPAMLISAAQPAQGQVLASPAFEALAQRTEAMCPARRVRLITPGDLDWEQESFEERLSPGANARLRAANTAEKRCVNNGLSCPTTATLEAMTRTGMMKAFSTFVCSHVPPS